MIMQSGSESVLELTVNYNSRILSVPKSLCVSVGSRSLWKGPLKYKHYSWLIMNHDCKLSYNRLSYAILIEGQIHRNAVGIRTLIVVYVLNFSFISHKINMKCKLGCRKPLGCNSE